MKDEFGKYYEATEPGRRERAYAWATAIGLQDVDGLKPSKYLRSKGYEVTNDLFKDKSCGARKNGEWYFAKEKS